jgi:molybdate transport system substrate-binding protein
VGTVRGETLRVFAAASLTESFLEIGGIFEAAHPGGKVEFNFAGSQVLRTQIEQGAAADVFASADRVDAAALETNGLLNAPQIFARNFLVVVIPADGARVRNLFDLAKPGVKIVVASRSAPVGRYTDETLGEMAACASFGSEYRRRVEDNVVSRETNVRAVLAKVSLGEADAGFVYRTDVAPGAKKLRVLAIPDSLNVVAEYPIAVVAGASSPDLGRAFIQIVLSSEGQGALRRHGFIP